MFFLVILFYLLHFAFVVAILSALMASSIMCSLGMSDDDSNGSKMSMHVMHPPTLKPLEPSMLCFWHMEWGKEKGKLCFTTHTYFSGTL